MCLSRKRKSWRGKSRGGRGGRRKGWGRREPAVIATEQPGVTDCSCMLPMTSADSSLHFWASPVFGLDCERSACLCAQVRTSVCWRSNSPLHSLIPAGGRKAECDPELFLSSSEKIPLFFSPPQSSWEPLPVDSEESKWDEPVLRHGEGDSRIYAH